jgi:hypothetical protein
VVAYIISSSDSMKMWLHASPWKAGSFRKQMCKSVQLHCSLQTCALDSSSTHGMTQNEAAKVAEKLNEELSAT